MLPDAFRRSDRPVVLGHRGSPTQRPENTIESFTAALAEGADGVELDVLQCETGELVVVHDPILTRLTGKNIAVRHAPWSLLRTLDVGSHLDARFASARIPLLAEVFEALPADALVNVELKGADGPPSPRMAREVARALSTTPRRDRLLVSSFDPVLLLAFHHAAPGFPLGWLFAADQRFGAQRAWLAPLLHASAVHPSVELCRSAALRRWRRARYGICVWTVDDPVVAHALSEVDALITNVPERIRRTFAAKS
jgi:glycerophosphoryl diester phosphodiesterase